MSKQPTSQDVERNLFVRFCKSLRCKQNFRGLRDLVGSPTWISHFDALTHTKTEEKLYRLLQWMYDTRGLDAKLYRHVEKRILQDIEDNALDQMEAESWL